MFTDEKFSEEKHKAQVINSLHNYIHKINWRNIKK